MPQTLKRTFTLRNTSQDNYLCMISKKKTFSIIKHCRSLPKRLINKSGRTRALLPVIETTLACGYRFSCMIKHYAVSFYSVLIKSVGVKLKTPLPQAPDTLSSNIKYSLLSNHPRLADTLLISIQHLPVTVLSNR